MITLKIYMTTNQNFYLQTLIVSCIKLKLKIYMKILNNHKEMFDFSN